MAGYTNVLNHSFVLVRVNKEGSCGVTCNVTLWRVGVILIPLRLSKQPDTISLEEYFRGDVVSPATIQRN